MNHELQELAERLGAMRWQTPASLPLPEIAQHLDEGTLVKHNRFRTTYRLQIAGLDLHLKHCRPISIRAWLRECLRPAKALLEFQKLCRLRKLGIPALAPVASGASRPIGPADSVLLTQTIPNTRTLGEFLDMVFPTLSHHEQTVFRQDLANSLGRLLARLARAGVHHADLHPGNLLVTWDGRRTELHLLDVHDVRFREGPDGSAEALVSLNRWFALRATRADRLRCYRAFERAFRPANAGHAPFPIMSSRTTARLRCGPRDIEHATLVSNFALWRSRWSRCFSDNRRFQTFAIDTAKGFALRAMSLGDIASIIRNPEVAIRKARIIKDSRSSTVAEITAAVGGKSKALILKHFKCPSIWRRVRHLFRKSACLRSWQHGHAFREALLPTPLPIAAWQVCTLGLPADGYVLQEMCDGTPLHESLQQLQFLATPQRVRCKALLIEALARLVRTMHDRGWTHRDLKAGNLLVAWRHDRPVVSIVDLVGASRSERLSVRRRQRDLMRLNASFWSATSVSRSDRVRFLRAYQQVGLRGKSAWKSWWRAIAQFTQEKRDANLRRGRVLA